MSVTSVRSKFGASRTKTDRGKHQICEMLGAGGGHVIRDCIIGLG